LDWADAKNDEKPSDFTDSTASTSGNSFFEDVELNQAIKYDKNNFQPSAWADAKNDEKPLDFTDSTASISGNSFFEDVELNQAIKYDKNNFQPLDWADAKNDENNLQFPLASERKNRITNNETPVFVEENNNRNHNNQEGKSIFRRMLDALFNLFN
jgi:hypothetical protein